MVVSKNSTALPQQLQIITEIQHEVLHISVIHRVTWIDTFAYLPFRESFGDESKNKHVSSQKDGLAVQVYKRNAMDVIV